MLLCYVDLGLIGDNYVYRDGLGNGPDVLIPKTEVDAASDPIQYKYSKITAEIRLLNP